MLKTLEHNEHAGHIAHGAHEGGHGGGHEPHPGAAPSKYSAQMASLLIAFLAAGLAISEQGAKHAEIRVQADLIAGADTWAQYQAKSTRSTLSKDVIAIIGALDAPAGADVADRRKQAVAALVADQERFDKDPKDGRDAVAHRAHEFEAARDHALEQTHAYHNGSAALELGIVLTTASAIIGSRPLMLGALCVGVIGLACAVAGYFAPEWGAF